MNLLQNAIDRFREKEAWADRIRPSDLPIETRMEACAMFSEFFELFEQQEALFYERQCKCLSFDEPGYDYDDAELNARWHFSMRHLKYRAQAQIHRFAQDVA